MLKWMKNEYNNRYGEYDSPTSGQALESGHVMKSGRALGNRQTPRSEQTLKTEQAEEIHYADGPLGRPRAGFDYVIATDGACSGNPGPGGWAWVDQVHGAYQSGGAAATTNNRMELTALLRALHYVPAEASLLIRADSSYVINSLTTWAKGWRKRGWRKADGKPVLNRELIEPLVNLYESRTGLTKVEWVKGHAGDAANEFVDRLAVAQSQRFA